MGPQRPYRALRAGAGAVVLATVVGVWVHSYVTGQQPGTLLQVVYIALVIASGFAVFGRDTFGAALDEAQDVQGGGEDDTED
ncbi:hypothetical protein NDI56_04035 [Haloarcula sp. S1CR25-12]|uniref:Uncharacterized protein n=1 Tax=Haloarcula saliterrae TaxID=2950534 RepID=A0ABU2F9Q9_9EURY|nr:hypothetical protein [Haloarcula sp. S1CR25-12]MDS0258580.1 hypothetical protein [Haloarcula sp. S1CR25-12]